MFDFARQFNELQLTDEEMALFSALIIFTPGQLLILLIYSLAYLIASCQQHSICVSTDRAGLSQVETIERIHSRIQHYLQTIISQNHVTSLDTFNQLLDKIPNLRTLNTIHSEKVLG